MADDLAAKPVATIHGAPGPLAVTGRVSDDGRNEIVFDRTGRPAPSVIVPDLNWVLPAVVLGLALIGALWRTAGDDRQGGCRKALRPVVVYDETSPNSA